MYTSSRTFSGQPIYTVQADDERASGYYTQRMKIPRFRRRGPYRSCSRRGIASEASSVCGGTAVVQSYQCPIERNDPDVGVFGDFVFTRPSVDRGTFTSCTFTLSACRASVAIVSSSSGYVLLLVSVPVDDACRISPTPVPVSLVLLQLARTASTLRAARRRFSRRDKANTWCILLVSMFACPAVRNVHSAGNISGYTGPSIDQHHVNTAPSGNVAFDACTSVCKY